MLRILLGDQMAVTGNDPIALAEWFIASLAIIIAVTLVYHFVLSRSPPPEGETVARLEHEQEGASIIDLNTFLIEAQSALQSADYKRAVENSVFLVSKGLGKLLSSVGGDTTHMNISDIAYLVQTKAKTGPQIAQPIYQLNSIRLKSLQGEPLTFQEAEWSVSTASWIKQVLESGQISF